jgi:hypothetical protein
MSNVNSDWDSWKRFLSRAVEIGEAHGISRDQIASLACQAGDFLAQNVQPANQEQKVLKELWDVSDHQEKQVLANLMTKLCSDYR